MNFSLKPNIHGNTFLPLRSREHHRREGGKNLKAGGWGNVSQNTPSRYDRWTRKEEDGTQKEKIGGSWRGNRYAYNQITLYICIKLSTIKEKRPLQIPPSQHDFLEIGMKK